MLSYQLKQRGPAFPERLTISLNGETGQYQVRRHEQANHEQMPTGRLAGCGKTHFESQSHHRYAVWDDVEQPCRMSTTG
jgi:hypothetical protein